MATMTPKQLGAAVRGARLERHWTQAELADETGLSREWVCKLEGGAPRLEHDKVLLVFGVLGFSLQTPAGQLATEAATSATRRRVSPKARARMLAELEKGQKVAGHTPSSDALRRAARVLDGEMTIEEAHAELDARFSKKPRA